MILKKFGNPRIQVLDANNRSNILYDVTLDMVIEPGGLLLTYDKVYYSSTNIGFKLKRKFQGRRLRCELDYRNKSNVDLTLKIGVLQDYQADDGAQKHIYKIYPRSNDTTFWFYAWDDVEQIQMKGLPADEAYEGLNLAYISEDLVTRLDFVDPATIQIAVFYFTRFFTRT